VFVCPSSAGERAPGNTAEEQAKHLSDPLHMTYVYVGKGWSAMPAHAEEMIVAYERPGNHNNDGMNFLHTDGYVQFQNREVSQHFVNEVAAGHNPPGPMPSAARR
jgi:hypothetical protein